MFSFFLGSGSRAEPVALESRTLDAVANAIKSGDVKHISVLTGAGISTAAGIPDFRSPETGLYANLARLNLPYAEAVFDISYFRKNPKPFYYLAKELYPGKFRPTISHAFIALLAKKGLLHMDFTQNIDCLERKAGVPDDKIVEAHGSFATQRCIDCGATYPDDDMEWHVEGEIVPRCDECRGLVKPDIVFFGEALPTAFRDNAHRIATSDLVIIIGTSLTVYPFAGLADMVPSGVPRLLLNKERVGHLGDRSDDVVELGPCDDGVRRLADLLGWREELEMLWRSVVGDKEADRQLGTATGGNSSVEDEIRKLTDGVETGLKLDDAGSTDGHGAAVSGGDDKEKESQSSTQPPQQGERESGAEAKETPLADKVLEAVPNHESKEAADTVPDLAQQEANPPSKDESNEIVASAPSTSNPNKDKVSVKDNGADSSTTAPLPVGSEATREAKRSFDESPPTQSEVATKDGDGGIGGKGPPPSCLPSS